MTDETDSSNSIPRQTPAGVDTPDRSTSESESDEDDTERTDGSGFAQSRSMTNGPGMRPGAHSPTPDSIEHSPFADQDEALDSLREIDESQDPVERLKAYANGNAAQALWELVEPPETAISEVQEAQDRAFQDIRAEAESRPLPEGIVYLEDVLFEFDLADDMRVNGNGVIEKVERKVRKLKRHLERKTERETEHPGTPSTNKGTESTQDRWRHLARATKVLERYPNLSSFKDFKDRVMEIRKTLGVEGLETPGEAIKKGVQRLRRDLTDEKGTPPRYHEMEGFQTLVDDLIRGQKVTLEGSSSE